MNFTTATCTDVGIKKETNQDSMLIIEAETDCGQVILVAVCDGMGGLAKGEVASAAAIHAISNWFKTDFPDILYRGMEERELQRSITDLLEQTNRRLNSYGRHTGIHLGTTVVAMIIANGKYFIVNVGDSRAYRISENVTQITKDQTFVQREIDAGRMTAEQAKRDSRRSVLLQCVGASEEIRPDFYSGQVRSNENYLLCCDGFRHVISNEEFFEGLNPRAAAQEQTMRANLQYFVDLNKYRRETDNISALLVHID